MTDKEIVERAKAAEKRIEFRDLVSSLMSSGVNSPYGIGFIEGMVEYRSSLPEEPVSEGLEAEIKRYVYDPYFNLNGVAIKGATEYLTVEDVADIARHFANWQKQQMMKDAIDGKVLINGMGNPILHLWDKGKHLIDKKVKVIVINEE